MVIVSVEIDGAPAAVYPALDGSGRYYLEARQGSDYTVSVANRTSGRLGISLIVDGLNAISGERGAEVTGRSPSGPGRLYVLEPWDRVNVRGWRTSLEEVRRFTFVEEGASYAARSGKANGKLGWIEVLVYPESDRQALAEAPESDPLGRAREGAATAPPGRSAPSGEAPAAPRASDQSGSAYEPELRSYPGTGWGSRAADPVTLVDFRPERRPAERITLRYEYLHTLVALGVVPRPWSRGDRLAQRERGGEGFAPPPPR